MILGSICLGKVICFFHPSMFTPFSVPYITEVMAPHYCNEIHGLQLELDAHTHYTAP